jgi:hypothetical protein
MALENLIGQVKELNEALPEATKGLNDVAEAATRAASVETNDPDLAGITAAANALDQANKSTITAAAAVAAIPDVGDATFTVTADETIQAVLRIGSGGGGGEGGSFRVPEGANRGVVRSSDGGSRDVARVLNAIVRGGGLLNPGPQGGGGRIQPLTPPGPTAGEKLIAAKLDSMAEAIRTSAEANGTTMRMGSKS